MDKKEELEILERTRRRLKKPEPVEEEEMLSTRQVLSFLGISHMTLKRDETLGRISHSKKGLSRVNWYRKSDVEALKKQREEIH